jgi:hypothetical protein
MERQRIASKSLILFRQTDAIPISPRHVFSIPIGCWIVLTAKKRRGGSGSGLTIDWFLLLDANDIRYHEL